MVCFKGYSGASGRKVVVPHVSAPGTGRMAFPHASDSSQVPGKTFAKASSSISRPSERLAQIDQEYLAAKYSFPNFNFIGNDSDYASAGNGTAVSIDSGRYASDDINFSASCLLSVPVPGRRIFGHLFHGLHDGGSGHRS